MKEKEEVKGKEGESDGSSKRLSGFCRPLEEASNAGKVWRVGRAGKNIVYG